MRRELARLLPNLAFLALLFGGQWLLSISAPRDMAVSAVVALAAWLLAAFAGGTIAHELGHALAVRLAGERVLGIQLGGQFAHVTFNLGTVPVSVGIGLGGSVSFRGHRLSAARRGVVAAAGPAANVLVAPFCLLLPVPRWEAAYLALGVLASGLADLAPGSAADGISTDGSRLWRTRARLRADAEVRELLENPNWQDRPDAADILINGFRLDVPEAEDCLRELAGQPQELLRLYLKPWTLPGKPEPDVTHIVHVLSWKVLVTGELSAETADLAASRAEWVIRHLDDQYPDKRTPDFKARHTLALARLRQGRTADVPRLCADALAADLEPDDRASVLATVAMARHARLLSGRQQLDEALALDPGAQLVSEAVRVLGEGWDAVLAAQPADLGWLNQATTEDPHLSLAGGDAGRGSRRRG
jgi:hypothetical protein